MTFQSGDRAFRRHTLLPLDDCLYWAPKSGQWIASYHTMSTIAAERRALDRSFDGILDARPACDLARDIKNKFRRARDQLLTSTRWPGLTDATNNGYELSLRPAVVERKVAHGYRAMSWVRQWWPRQPFRNVFLIRNPTVQFRGVIDYDGKTEVRVVPGEEQRLSELREAFVSLPASLDHFDDPGASWDALMQLNDGGSGRLAAALAQVCTADLKLGQVAARLGEIRSDVVETLLRYHVSDDLAKRRSERLAFVDDVLFADFNECADRARFGSALRGLMIDASDLYAALMESLNRPDGEAPEDVPDVPQKRAGPFGARKEVARTASRPDRWSRLADASLARWANFLQACAENAVFSRRVGIQGSTLREMTAEIGAAARPLALAERIAAELRLRAAPNEQNEAIARKAALVAERLINRFVSELDFDRVPPAIQIERFGEDLDEPVFARRPVAFDASGIGAEPPEFAIRFMEQWGSAFRATVSHNAVARTGTIEEAAQNARLGKILEALAA